MLGGQLDPQLSGAATDDLDQDEEQQDMTSETYSGPVDYAVFVVPGTADVSAALRLLLERIDAGAIEILDLEVIGLDDSGRPVRRPVGVLDHGEAFDFAVYNGAESDLFDADDLASVAAELTGDELAIAIVYEDRSLAAVADSVVGNGGRLLWAGGIAIDELEHALETTEEEH
ncbi:MAG: hypothetical protein BGO95_09850 [Micrococcales bacterium 73-13]|nr:MAG: hypothetical protein BGO95_09850 [Micrococcales bacterium 73-13]